jgi:hypothetical protein
MDVREVLLEDVDWMNLVQDREKQGALVNTVMKLRVPKRLENFFGSVSISLSRRLCCMWLVG